MMRTVWAVLGMSALAMSVLYCGDEETTPTPTGSTTAGTGGTETGTGGGTGGTTTGGTGGTGGTTAGGGGVGGTATGSGGAGGGGGGTGGAGGSGGSAHACTTICQTTDPLNCANEAGCDDWCHNFLDSAPWCQSDVEPYLECLALEPVGSWHCDAQGNPRPNNGICVFEGATALDCLYDGPAGGLPDLSTECAAACTNIDPLACSGSNCVAWCQNTLANGPCAGALAAMVLCWSALTPSDFYCNAQNFPESLNDLCLFSEGLYVTCVASQ